MTTRTTNDNAAHPDDEAAVRGLYQQLMDGWNQGSGAAFAAAFAEDGDLVAFDSTHFEGRQEIASFHQQLFDKWMKGTRLVGRVRRVRFLGPDVAVLHAVGGTVMRGKTEPSPERDSSCDETGERLAPRRVPKHPSSPHSSRIRCISGLGALGLVVEDSPCEQGSEV